MPLTLQFLNARQGDAIWVRWGSGHQLLIDMGTARTGEGIADRVRELAEDEREFELLVNTHVDSDHIGGVVSGLVEATDPIPNLRFNDVWFNGLKHLQGLSVPEGAGPLESMGVEQGQQFADFLAGHNWNAAFGGGPVRREDDNLPRVEFPDGLTLTILGPSRQRLEALIPTWQTAVETEILGEETAAGGGVLEAMGPTTPPELGTDEDLDDLAGTGTATDPSLTNGTSICLLLEWEQRRVILTGDGFADDIVEGLRLVNDGQPVACDVFKAAHHGSKNNMSRELVEMLSCPTWVFSSDGTTFHHPDAIAIGRILRWRQLAEPTSLVFNVPSTFNGWWDNEDWIAAYNYSVTYGDADDGVSISFDD